jgi:hypothetical protein
MLVYMGYGGRDVPVAECALGLLSDTRHSFYVHPPKFLSLCSFNIRLPLPRTHRLHPCIVVPRTVIPRTAAPHTVALWRLKPPQYKTQPLEVDADGVKFSRNRLQFHL